jgi:hypothetical protein
MKESRPCAGGAAAQAGDSNDLIARRGGMARGWSGDVVVDPEIARVG